MDRELVKSENKTIYILQRFVIRYCSWTISSPATCQVAIEEECNPQHISWPNFTCYAPDIVSLSRREVDDIQQIDRCFQVCFCTVLERAMGTVAVGQKHPRIPLSIASHTMDLKHNISLTENISRSY